MTKAINVVCLFILFFIISTPIVSYALDNKENFLTEQAKMPGGISQSLMAEPPYLLDSVFFHQFGTFDGSDCWGYSAPDGNQYAFMGIHVGIVAVNATTFQIVDTVTGSGCLWQDLKTYDHYLYGVSECGSGLRVIDLQYLPDSLHLVSILPTSDMGTFSSHNISVDTVKGFLYAEGTNGFGNNIFIHDLANPANPVFVNSFGFYSGEIHDIWASNDTIFVAEGNAHSISLFETSDKNNPYRIAYLSIPNPGYVHNVWPTADKKYMVTTEETVGKTVKIWDIQDIHDIKLVGEYIGPNQFAHNAHILGDYVYLSHYGSGTRVIDIRIPSCPLEIAAFDTPFDNTWGCYPFNDDSLVYGSDLDGTFRIFRLRANPAYVPDDSDGDGIESTCDNCPTTPNVSQTDDDEDGVGNDCDNCPSVFNDQQTDSDGDGIGDACDVCAGFDDNLDADSDNVPDGCDVCAGFDDNLDSDSDGVPNGCDKCAGFDDNLDGDFDGVPDACDNCPTVFNPGQADADSNGVGDICCCVQMTGDVNYDGSQFPDILDLTFMVDYKFRGGAPSSCDGEADVDKDSEPSTILDLTFIVDYIFRGGAIPPLCD